MVLGLHCCRQSGLNEMVAICGCFSKASCLFIVRMPAGLRCGDEVALASRVFLAFVNVPFVSEVSNTHTISTGGKDGLSPSLLLHISPHHL